MKADEAKRLRGYAGVFTGPNMLVAGELGKRKSIRTSPSRRQPSP